jgi:hypothetical protein
MINRPDLMPDERPTSHAKALARTKGITAFQAASLSGCGALSSYRHYRRDYLA